MSGNTTTVGTNYGPDNPLVPNLNLTQVYSKIVNSSIFQTLAAGRTWVTLDWGIAQMGPAPPPTVVVGQFLFISGGVPDPYGFAQMEYYVASGEVAGGLVPDQSSCTAQDSPGFGLGFRLLAGTSAVGQPAEMNFTLTNLSTASMTIKASASCLGNFTVLQGFFGPVVYDSAKHPTCTGPPLKVVLAPGQSYAQTVEWNQTDDNGAQVPAGNYMIFATEVGYLGQIFPVPVEEGLTIGNQTAG